MLAIVDAGPLYAAVDTSDKNHQRGADVLLRPDLQLVVPAMVVAEVTYLVGTRLGPVAEARFLAGLAILSVEAPLADDWHRIAALVAQYGNFPLGGTGASVVALAERLDTDLIITFDERHFRAVRPRHRAAFRLLPADAGSPHHCVRTGEARTYELHPWYSAGRRIGNEGTMGGMVL